MSRHRDIAGQRFGRWLVVRREGRDKHRNALWLCRCACGATGHVATASLTCGQSLSCGCLQRDAVTKHGNAKMHEYRVWKSLRARCTLPSHNRFTSYAGRGITVCERWQSFEAFLADMGKAPPGATIERIDNDGSYEPGNCRWATVKEQARNRRSTLLVELDGKMASLAAHCEERGVDYHRVWRRIRKLGMSPERAFA